MSYTLSFREQWSPEKLVRKGGEQDPLERKLRTVNVDQYGDVVVDEGKKIPKKLRLLSRCEWRHNP